MLLIEDNEDDEQFSLRALKSLNLPLKVFVARDGKEAAEMLCLLTKADDCLTPDLIICDLHMNGMDGHEVLRLARQNETLKGVPFVIFSSSADSADIQRSKALAASDHCQKPVEAVAFTNAVHRIVNRWLQVRTSGTVRP